MSKNQIEIKTVTSLNNIIVQLESLIESLATGYLTIATQGKALILQPQDPFRFEMEAASKANKSGAHQQLSVKFKWQRKPDAWNSMIRTSVKNQAPGKSADAPCRLTDSIKEMPDECHPGSIPDLDAFAGLSPTEVQVQEKPQRKPHPRKPAATRKRKTRV